jgi:hypothetical protein
MPELIGWKAIAGYLKVSVRTAQNRRGLPIQRIEGRGQVFATTEALDEWKEKRSVRAADNPVSSPRLLLVLGSVGLVFLIAIWLLPQPRVPAHWRVTKNTLIVDDDAGKEIWHVTFPDELEHVTYDAPPPDATLGLTEDLDGDGTTETLFVLRKDTRYAESNVLICFSQEGKELWRFVPGRAIRTATDTLENHYRIPLFRVARFNNSGKRVIIVSGYHYLSYPVQVSVLDLHGNLLKEYWHAGHVGIQPKTFLVYDLDHDGKSELYLGGIDQSHKLATLIVLDPEHMTGTSKETDPAYQIQDLPLVQERARVFFPRSSMNLLGSDPYNEVHDLHPSTSGLTVDTIESYTDRGQPTILWDLDLRLRLRDVGFGDIFESSHEHLRRASGLPNLTEEHARLRVLFQSLN